jgi:hypothetical protein
VQPCVMPEKETVREFKDVLWHPLVLVILGAGVVWDAPGNIVVRSIFLIVLWILVSIDVGWLLWRLKWQIRIWAIVVCVASSATGIGVMGDNGVAIV